MASILSTISRRTAGTVAGLVVGSAVAYGAHQYSSSTSGKATTSSSDPYANLPATDEPTHCTICRTNRNGPCKNLWRKFEYCMKDNPPKRQEDDNGSANENGKEPPPASEDDRCNKYMMDWIPCVRSNFMLYAMFANQVDADYYDKIEQRLLENNNVVKEWKADDIDVDWSDYLSMLQAEHMNIVDVYTADQRVSEPLWKEGDTDETLLAVEVFVRVNLQDDDLPIAICYARDDIGSIIGVGHFKQQDEEGNQITENAMTITFRPNKTRRIQLFKLYEEELGDDEPERPLKKIAYVSEEIDLLEVAHAAGTFAPYYVLEGADGEKQSAAS